jgi:Tfp pilus assembly pilus retraction ATPase PilT
VHINEFLKVMVGKGASDLHLTVPRQPVLRVEGAIITQEDMPVFTSVDIESVLEQITTVASL